MCTDLTWLCAYSTGGFVGGPMTHPNKSKMAAAAIFNFGKMSITFDWIKISCNKLYGKMHRGDDNVTKI